MRRFCTECILWVCLGFFQCSSFLPLPFTEALASEVELVPERWTVDCPQFPKEILWGKGREVPKQVNYVQQTFKK